MGKILSVFVFFGFSLLSGQIEKTEKKTFYDQQGRKTSEGYMVNGKPDGFWVAYYGNGVVSSKGIRRNNTLDSIWNFYYENGMEKSMVTYKNGKKNGLYVLVDSLQEKRVESFYKNDSLFGFSCTYNKVKQFWKKEFCLKYYKNKKNGISFWYDRVEDRIIELKYFQEDRQVKVEKINQKEYGKKQGVWREYDDDGILLKEYFYKDDVLQGNFQILDKRGKTSQVLAYKDGKIVKDEKQEILDKKRKQAEKPLATTLQKEFGKNKRLLSEGYVDEYKNKTGRWKFYYENAVLKAEGVYKNNVKQGFWTYYYENSNVKQEGNYDKNGFLTEEWVWYFPNGQKRRVENYDENKENGKFQEWNQNGKLIAQGDFVEGQKQGIWKEIYEPFLCVGNYVEGKRNGLWSCFFENDRKYFEGKFKDNTEIAKHIYYQLTGKIMFEKNYKQGKIDGKVIWYNKNQEPFLEIDYKENEPILVNDEKI
jgi:uncharacterized protein